MGMKKYERMGVYFDWQPVKSSDKKLKRYDAQMTSVERTLNFYGLTRGELNDVLKALDVLEKRKWREVHEL